MYKTEDLCMYNIRIKIIAKLMAINFKIDQFLQNIFFVNSYLFLKCYSYIQSLSRVYIYLLKTCIHVKAQI